MGSGGDLVARLRLLEQALEHGENLTRQNDGATFPIVSVQPRPFSWQVPGHEVVDLAVWPALAMRSRVWVSQALGSTPFILAVVRSVAIVAHVRPPPSLPANSAFLRVMVWGLIARSTMLEFDLDAAVVEEALERRGGRWCSGWPRPVWICRTGAAVRVSRASKSSATIGADWLRRRLRRVSRGLAADDVLEAARAGPSSRRCGGEGELPLTCSS